MGGGQVVHALDLIVSSVGVELVRAADDQACASPLAVMRKAYGVTAFLAVVSYVAITRVMLFLPSAPAACWLLALSGLLGILSAYALILITQYFTDYDFPPVSPSLSHSLSLITHYFTPTSTFPRSLSVPLPLPLALPLSRSSFALSLSLVLSFSPPRTIFPRLPNPSSSSQCR